MERNLASIQRIAEVQDIPKADNLQHYRINGWWVVDRKDQHKVGDLVIYLEIDSWVPTELAPFLSKGKEPRIYNEVAGERLRTIKLRGAISQGLLLPLPCQAWPFTPRDEDEGRDLTESLNIQKWEKPIPAGLAGMMKGNFPHFFPKTDQTRVQNLSSNKLAEWRTKYEFQVTEKLDGSSMSIYFHEGEWGVTSRNVDLKLDQEGNSFVNMFNRLQPNLKALQAELGIDTPFALQGELIGPSIQGNPYKLTQNEFFVYDLYLISENKYTSPDSVELVCTNSGINHVPVVEYFATLPEDFLAQAEGISILCQTKREGIVYKSYGHDVSFKAISNSWLLKNE